MAWIARFFVLVMVLSIGELYLLLAVAAKLSMLATLALCILTGVVGGALVRAQGMKTLRSLRAATRQGQLPATTIVSGLILLMIGTLLLTPGFITDSMAFLLLVPKIRAIAAEAILKFLKRRGSIQSFSAPRSSQTQRPEDVVIEVEAKPVNGH